MRVLHVLIYSVPYTNGYTVRSRYLVDAQRTVLGFDPVVVTSPFAPDAGLGVGSLEIGGTRYQRVPHPVEDRLERSLDARLIRLLHRLARKLPRHLAPAVRLVEEILLMRRFRRELRRLIRAEQPDVVHAHTPYRIARPAAQAARAEHVPVVYEVRGLWEDSAVASGRIRQRGLQYTWFRYLENATLHSADAVIALSEGLRNEIVRRGVPSARAHVVPNAVDTTAFPPSAVPESDPPPEVADLKAHLRPFCIGYVGSVRSLEGIDELLRGGAEMVQRGHDVSILIVGSGPALSELRELAGELGLGERAIFTGRVPHDHVAFYYRLIDVLVISRPDLQITRLVTPLKPLEAMAMGCAVVVSDLPALRELVIPEETGLVYTPGNPGELAAQCARLQEDDALRERLVTAALRWVQKERSWSVVVKRTRDVYESITRGSH